MELEQILHGPAMSFDEETLVAIIAPSGPSVKRASDLLAAAKTIGTKTLVVTDRTAETEANNFEQADYVIKIPESHEYLSPFLGIIPLYLFAYYLSVEVGYNPDYLRYLEQSYWDARNIIFPPGTH